MTAFEEWYEKYDGGHGISEQSCRDGWNAALEEALSLFKDLPHQYDDPIDAVYGVEKSIHALKEGK